MTLSYTITPSTLMQCSACCKCEKILGAVIPTSVEPWGGKNGDPQIGWMKEGVFVS